MLLLDVSQVTHTVLIDIQYLIYYIPSINYLHVHWFFDFCILDFHFGLYTLNGSIGTEYSIFVDTSFDIRTARVRCQGELSPPPGHAPPRQESRTSWSIG